MKHLRERIFALGMALCLCLSLCAVPASAAGDRSQMPTEENNTYGEYGEIGKIDLKLTLEKSGSDYKVTYKADTTMVDWLAQAAAVCREHTSMNDLRFTCTLTDELTATLTSGDVNSSNYEFTGVKHDRDIIFVPDGSKAVTVSDGSIKLCYKLNTTALNAIGGVEEVKNALRQQMTMTSKNTVISASKLAGIGSTIHTTAQIDVSMADGSDIPFYDVKTVTAASGAKNTTNPEYSGGGGGGSVTPAKPTVEVVDKTPSVTKPTTVDPTTGEPTTGELPPAETVASYLPVGGGTTTVENPNAKPGEDVRIKTESDKGSMVNYITVKDENGNRIPVTYDGKGKFTFEMPENGNVTIEANYRVIPADPKETGVAELLNTKDHILYMIGDDKGDFRPNASISRAEVATAFFRLLNDQNVKITQHFDDVSAKNWYVQPVETLASLHIIEGVGSGTFEPNRAITRAEFAAIAARFANALTAGTSFADVDEDAWYAVFVSTAASFGWINGVGNGMYEPNRPITRTEAAAIINRMLLRISDWIEVDAGAGRQFPDVGENFWGRYEISEAVNGHDHTLEEEYFHEDWLAEDWREAVDNDPVNFGQKH